MGWIVIQPICKLNDCFNPKEMKEAVIAGMFQGDETIMDIQRDTGIGINTLYRWRDKALNQNVLSATTKY